MLHRVCHVGDPTPGAKPKALLLEEIDGEFENSEGRSSITAIYEFLEKRGSTNLLVTPIIGTYNDLFKTTIETKLRHHMVNIKFNKIFDNKMFGLAKTIIRQEQMYLRQQADSKPGEKQTLIARYNELVVTREKLNEFVQSAGGDARQLVMAIAHHSREEGEKGGIEHFRTDTLELLPASFQGDRFYELALKLKQKAPKESGGTYKDAAFHPFKFTRRLFDRRPIDIGEDLFMEYAEKLVFTNAPVVIEQAFQLAPPATTPPASTPFVHTGFRSAARSIQTTSSELSIMDDLDWFVENMSMSDTFGYRNDLKSDLVQLNACALGQRQALNTKEIRKWEQPKKEKKALLWWEKQLNAWGVENNEDQEINKETRIANALNNTF
jgi:hypothetical protein